MQDSNGGHGTKIDRTSVYYICATAFMLKIFSAIKLKMLERWIWHFHIFSHFKKYFLKIFLKNWFQTYFHFHFLFLMKMEIENRKPNTPLYFSCKFPLIFLIYWHTTFGGLRLAANWPPVMQIVRLISQDHMNNKSVLI